MAYKRNGKWRVQATVAGSRISECFPTRDMARDFEAKLRRSRYEQIPEPSMKRFGVFAQEWLARYADVRKSETSVREDRSIIKNHLEPAFGNLLMGRITRGHMLDYMGELKRRIDKSDIKAKTANNVLLVATKIMKTAAEWSEIQNNPWAGVGAFQIAEQPFAHWTPQEAEQFHQTARFRSTDIDDLVTLALHTGMRLGELMALEWQDVHLSEGQITVRATYSAPLKRRLPRTKNRKIGYVPLNKPARAVIEGRQPGDSLVFPGMIATNVTPKFQRLAKAAGVRVIRFHDLRHTFASWLVMNGVDLYAVQRLMRHSSISMTERYAHLAPAHLAAQVARIDCTQFAPETVLETANNHEDLEKKWRPQQGSNPLEAVS